MTEEDALQQEIVSLSKQLAALFRKQNEITPLNPNDQELLVLLHLKILLDLVQGFGRDWNL